MFLRTYPAVPFFFALLLYPLLFRTPAVPLKKFFFRTFPAVPQFPLFAYHLPCCTEYSVPLFFYALTLLCRIFLRATLLFPPIFFFALCCVLIPLFVTTYPAVPLFFYALLLRPPSFRLPLTLLCPYFSAHSFFVLIFFSHLPCCALIPLFAYHPAVPLSRFSLTTYPA